MGNGWKGGMSVSYKGFQLCKTTKEVLTITKSLANAVAINC
jgi:hypothetical protein